MTIRKKNSSRRKENGAGFISLTSSDLLGDNRYAQAFRTIAHSLNSGATVLFTACNIALRGGKLTETIFNVLGGKEKNLTLYTNRASTESRTYGNSMIVGQPLVQRRNRWDSWIRTTSSGSVSLPKSSNVQLNRNGTIGEIDMPMPYKPYVSPLYNSRNYLGWGGAG